MIHIDIKELGRFDRIGHRITGDRTGQSNDRTSRQILPDEKKEGAVASPNAATAYYASLGVTISRVMTDNGGCDLMWWTASAPGIAMCQSVAVESHIRESRPWSMLAQSVWISPSMSFRCMA
ncbi:hypothetical protein GHK69_07295 [Sinorhizobium meliloti]|nr:hypothetical protein [Sinorhizobium meliloti]